MNRISGGAACGALRNAGRAPCPSLPLCDPMAGRAFCCWLIAQPKVVQERPKQEKCSRLPGRRSAPSTRTKATEQVFFSFFRFAFFIFPDFSAISHFSCPRFHFAFSCPRFHFAFSCPRFHFAFFLHSRRWRPPVIARRGKCRVSSLGVLGRVGERGHPGGRRQREQRRAGVHARKTRSGVRTQRQ